ncbi:choline dehydrogenase [Xylaria bambusicola]|uniref:choline dehydrogenase n=1 Tax=Xylaria bambusicola TaxID=326684 RepID=UPI002008464C|nr:choline dehydrogenase [Xylaria bambusicola]KAI0525952.1 choline dehydrogenase [Xylaria bambusicola]
MAYKNCCLALFQIKLFLSAATFSSASLSFLASFSYLALLSAITPYTQATDLAPNGPDVTVARVPEQLQFPQTGPTLPVHEPQAKEYEYIIIGSGAGGSPIAANLARAGHSVLLVDAGGDFGYLRQVDSPALANPASERVEASWAFFTHHYTNETMALKDRKLAYLTPDGQWFTGKNSEIPEGSKPLGNFYPRYAGLGGCTEHNALVGLLPTKNDLGYIANLTGDSSWELENMRKYYEKLSNAQYLNPDEHDGYVDLNINPEGIAAQDVKLMSSIIGAARAFGVDATAVDALANAVDQVIATASKAGVDPYTELVPLNYTKPITDAMGNVLFHDANTDAPDRDTMKLFSRLPETIDNVDYRRSSPRDYVYKTVTAKNADGSKKYPLDVALNTLVTKITFDNKATCPSKSGKSGKSKKPKATGIEYLHGQSLYRADARASKTENGGKPGSVRATKEVIVAGGAFNSPQILKLSGVGPKEELEKFKIPVVLDLPGVGTNLQDRLEVSVNGMFPTNFTRILDCTFLATEEDPCWDRYADKNNKGAAKGAYASSGNYFGAFWTSSFSEDGEQDLWIGGFPGTFNGFFPGYSSSAATPTYKNYWSWLILKAHTRNRSGTVKLQSANPRDVPLISFHSMYEGLPKEEADKEVGALLEGVRMAQSFYANTPDVDGKPTQWWPPADFNSDDDIKQWITEEAWGHHASCSNPIGSDDDPMAVLDGDFRVRGIDSLRVVDASVFPKIPGTFIALPVMLIAEKASAVILGQ